jgi:arylsulfatase A-like enzyme
MEVIRGHAHSSQPFFLYLAYNAPHTPIQPPDDWIERVRQREPDASSERVKYVALVEHMDAGIGRVLDTLEETGQLSNTLVVYTSDNGGQLNVGATNGPLRGAKGQMYEGGIRVPACAMWPGEIEEGYVSDEIGMLMDLLPTACDVAGVSVDHEIEGLSILPTLRGDKQDFSDRTMYWVRREGNQQFLGLNQHAVRRGDIKLLHNSPFEPLELYDLGSDTKEAADQAEVQGDMFREMGRLLQTEMQKAGRVVWQK